jgi:Zn-dependent M28 family amino/carboxypeptidase
MQAAEPGAQPILLEMEISASAALRREEKQMVNLLGWLEGTDPALKDAPLLVIAHHDAMGRAEDGALLAGASDNAAGVAALLETARLLAAPGHRAPRGILFAALDGEEWGLTGSHALAGRLSEMPVHVAAVINIDSLGAGDPTSVFLIGGSHQPEIRTLVARAAPLVGLRLGRDIDPYAFDYGSDFYPFHLAGLAAVGFFAADYRALHRPTDTVESLNAEALGKAARLAALTVWALAN